MKLYEIIERPASRNEPGTVDPDDGDRVIWVRAECISHVQAALGNQRIPHLADALQSVHEINFAGDLNPLGLDLEVDADGDVSEVSQW